MSFRHCVQDPFRRGQYVKRKVEKGLFFGTGKWKKAEIFAVREWPLFMAGGGGI